MRTAETLDVAALIRAASADDHERIARLEVELDQCWDLLRQRRARREFGLDPDGASARAADTVEKYKQ